jgi:DNA primase catalytic core
MPRIPAAELARLKANTDLPAFLRAQGLDLKPHGASDLVGTCPFHDDKTPSLVVTPSKGLWHCMGACQTGGDIVSFVMKADGLSFRDAVARLGGRLEVACPFTVTADDQTLLNQVTAHYQGLLRLSPAGRGYLQRRGLLHEEMIQTFKLGLSERSPGLPLPPRARPEGSALRDRLAAVGVLRQTTGHEHLAGSLVVPILDASGNTLNFYGRKIIDHLRAGTPSHLYLSGPHRGVFNVQGLHGPEIILCESLLDALSFWVHGFQNVTAAYGVEGFTEEILAALKASGTSSIAIAYDRDEAGDKAAEKLGKRLRAEGFGCRRVRFPHGMDANDYICRMKPAQTALKLLLDTAVPMDKDGKLKAPPVPVREDAAPPVLDAPAAPAPSLVAPPEPPAAPVQAPTPAPAPEAPKPQAAEVRGEDVFLTFGDRAYRVRGLFKNLTYDHLKVNLRAAVGDRFFLDQLDLYNARHRETFVQNAAVELEHKQEVLKKDLGRMLVELERLQDEAIRKTLAVEDPAVPPMPEAERREALALLQDPDLVGRILQDFEALGVVGESMNKLTAYLACVSRKMDKPLGLLIQSTSAAGKTALMDAVIGLLPPDEYVRYSAMTAQSLYYMDPQGLKHKVLCICEEEGAERASYALKLLQSDGRLTIAAAGKDEKTGKLLTQEYSVEGPVAVLLSTTSVNVDEELQNRCLTLTVDESREQTQRIHAAQRERETVDGLLRKERGDRLTRLHQNAQRLLRPLKVANNYAPYLTFVDGQTRTRRDHVKYLTLIRAVTLLHQYQRPIKVKDGVEYIETTLEDIALANRLAHQVLGRTLDELPPQTRNLLRELEKLVRKEAKERGLRPSEVRFTRREVREATGWGNTQLKVHLGRLEDLEYLQVHRLAQGRGTAYELLYRGEGREGEPFLLGLTEVEALRERDFDSHRSGVNGPWSGAGRPQVGPWSGGGRGGVDAAEANGHGLSTANGASEGGNEDRGEKNRAHQSLLIPRSKASFSLVAS